MAIEIRLTTAQSLQLLELIGRLECADKRTLGALRMNGHHLGTLRRACYEIASGVVRGEGGDARSFQAIRRLSMAAAERIAADRMTWDANEVEVSPPKRKRRRKRKR